MHHDSECIFCHMDRSKALAENQSGFVVYDAYPVTNGHSIIIPNEHEPDYFLLPAQIRKGIDELVLAAKEHLDAFYGPDGYNIGINNGEAAGQTVMHAHIHLIPRYFGDADDPRGGIRWMFPKRANYFKL